MPGPADVIRTHIDAFNARDAEREPWSADAEMVAPGGSVSGRAEVLGFLSVFHEAFSDGRLEIITLLSDGSAAAVEGAFTGTHDGILHTPDGDVPATHRAITFRWSALYTVEGSELTSEHLFFDQLGFLRQLGLLPE